MANVSPRPRNTGQKRVDQTTKEIMGTAIKKAEKERAKNKVNQEGKAREREPKPRAGIPPAPEGIGRHGQRFWAETAPELDRMGVLALLDKAALESLVSAYDTYHQLREDIRNQVLSPQTHPTMFTKHGWPIVRKGKHVLHSWTNQTGSVTFKINGMVKTNPTWMAMERAQAKLLSHLVEFGMTPASRSRVEVLPDDEDDKDEFDDL